MGVENYILHEFLANRSDFLAECSWKHHHLFIMGSQFENLLHIFSHVCKGQMANILRNKKSHIQTRQNTQLRRQGGRNRPSDSSILSHSSSIKCLTFFKPRSLSLVRARILPGVPTTMCGHSFLSKSLWTLMLTPP